MRLEFHPQVTADISRIMDYYEDVAEPQLADEFYRELRSFFQRAAESPEAYEISEHDLRRVNLERFPIISCSVLSATECGFWLFVITGDDHR